jgi:hypothetical protein
MTKTKTVEQVLKLYAKNPHLIGGFGEDFGKRLIAVDEHN